MSQNEPIDLDDPKFAGGYVLGEDPETGEVTAIPAGYIDPAVEVTQTDEPTEEAAASEPPAENAGE